MNLDEYSYLWDGSQLGWVLVRGEPLAEYSDIVYNTETRVMIAIEDPILASQVRARMREARAGVIDEIPAGDFVP